MDNYVLKQFGDISVSKAYEFGTIIEVKSNNIYLVETFNGLQLTIQDTSVDYEVDNLVLLALSEGSTNNVFIIKKSSKKYPISVNFVVGNGLN